MNEQVKNTLAALRRGQQVTVIYDGKFEQKLLRITGKVVNVDTFWQTLQVNKIGIDFSEIHDIEIYFKLVLYVGTSFLHHIHGYRFCLLQYLDLLFFLNFLLGQLAKAVHLRNNCECSAIVPSHLYLSY